MKTGTNSLMTLSFWRISAENLSRLTCGFQESATRVMLIMLAAPSDKALVICQNRYPSPSLRSDPFPVRPQTLSGLWFGELGPQSTSFLDAAHGRAPFGPNHPTRGVDV